MTDVDVAASLLALREQVDGAIAAKRHELDELQAERQRVTEWLKGHARDTNGPAPAEPKKPTRRYTPSAATVDKFTTALRALNNEATVPEISAYAGLTDPSAYTIARYLEASGGIKQVGVRPRPDGTGRAPALWAPTAQPEPWENQHQAT